jgi:hypothetical protein
VKIGFMGGSAGRGAAARPDPIAGEDGAALGWPAVPTPVRQRRAPPHHSSAPARAAARRPGPRRPDATGASTAAADQGGARDTSQTHKTIRYAYCSTPGASGRDKSWCSGDQLQAVERAGGREHGQAVGALGAARLVHAQLLDPGEHGVEDPTLGLMDAQADAELDQHAAVSEVCGDELLRSDRSTERLRAVVFLAFTLRSFRCYTSALVVTMLCFLHSSVPLDHVAQYVEEPQSR